jgi:hypothetical protein
MNFNNENLIGEGGFGRVYKGLIAKTNQVLLLLYDVKCLPLFLTSKPKKEALMLFLFQFRLSLLSN